MAENITTTNSEFITNPLVYWINVLLLGSSVVVGAPMNVVFLRLLRQVEALRRLAGIQLFVLITTNALHCLVSAPALLIRVTSSSTHAEPLCHVAMGGMVFTNAANYMLLTGMAIQRFRIITGAPIRKPAVQVMISVFLAVATAMTVFQILRPGISYHLCVGKSTAQLQQGSSGIMWLMMMPFVCCVTLSVALYVILYHRISTSAIAISAYNVRGVLVKPLVGIFMWFLLCYLPVTSVIIIRRGAGMTPSVSHAQIVTNAINFASHALSPIMYIFMSRKMVCKIHVFALTVRKTRPQIRNNRQGGKAKPPAAALNQVVQNNPPPIRTVAK